MKCSACHLNFTQIEDPTGYTMLHCHLEDPVLAVKQLRLGQRAGARAEISQKEVKETPGFSGGCLETSGLRFKRADRLGYVGCCRSPTD